MFLIFLPHVIMVTTYTHRVNMLREKNPTVVIREGSEIIGTFLYHLDFYIYNKNINFYNLPFIHI